MSFPTRRARPPYPLVVGLVLASALTLAGCAAAESEGAETAPAQDLGQQDDARGGGVSGTIAAASDGVLQVQDTESQTAVSYTADTTIQSEVAGTFADVTVGSCVTVVTATGEDDAEADSTASTVTVSAAVDGECASGFGGQGGSGVPSGTPSDFPDDAELPSDAPTDGSGGGAGGFGGFTSGLVTAVAADSFTVDAVGSDDTTTSTDVTVGDDTAYTATVDADATALVVGQCVTAQGTADDDGGFAATALTVSEPGEDGCTTGFGGGGMPGDPGAATEAG